MVYNGTLNASLRDCKCNCCTLYIALSVGSIVIITSINDDYQKR